MTQLAGHISGHLPRPSSKCRMHRALLDGYECARMSVAVGVGVSPCIASGRYHEVVADGSALMQEDGAYLLQEDGSKILL